MPKPPSTKAVRSIKSRSTFIWKHHSVEVQLKILSGPLQPLLLMNFCKRWMFLGFPHVGHRFENLASRSFAGRWYSSFTKNVSTCSHGVWSDCAFEGCQLFSWNTTNFADVWPLPSFNCVFYVSLDSPVVFRKHSCDLEGRLSTTKFSSNRGLLNSLQITFSSNNFSKKLFIIN